VSARAAASTLVGAVALAAASVFAQQPAPQPPDSAAVFPVTADIVWIDAVAVDGSERPVATLAPEDFAVLDRGERRPILLFRAPDAEATGRSVVFLIEDALAREGHVAWARDLVSRAASRAAKGDQILLVAPASHVAGSMQLPDAANALRAALARVKPHDELARAASDASELRRLNESRVDSILVALAALRGHPGPRALVVLGPPCPYRADGPFGRAAYERVMRASQLAAAPVYFLEWEVEWGPLAISEPGPGPEPAGEALAGVTPVVPTTSLAAPPQIGALLYEKLAEDSGGFATRTHATWSWSLGRVYERARAGYLLGIPSGPESQDGRYHPLEVRVARGGVKLYSRKGYFAPKAR
jgi:VWFA-related protein